ncbi:MAG: hypothetical protein NC311_05570 [Muribaculaceae bacterium]|nr:hypothetical protein [Muribaculaceae bacterium]
MKRGTKTTLGLYIANKYLFEDLEIFGYINTAITGKLNGKIDEKMAKALQAGDITREQYGVYIDRAQWLYGGPLAFIINVSLSETVMSLPKAAKARRQELLEKNKVGIERNDPQVSAHIEKEVVSVALDEMRKHPDPSMALFDSGCGLDPYNQYKTIFVMKGAVQDNTGESPTGYKIVTSNYDEGVSKEDMSKIADSVVTTAYSSGVATQDSGTNGKRYNALFQRVRLQARGSDCKTTDTLNVEITEDNADDYVYRYIMEGSKPVMLTPESIKSYYGKTVKMRSGIHCKAPDPEYCSCCVGDRPYRIGIRNIGFAFMSISGSTLNASLKKKHDVSIKLYNVKLSDVLKYVA